MSFNVLAFAVSTSYYEGRPLVLQPGESRDIALTMQNMAGATEDLKVNAEITSGKEIVSIIDKDNNYLVPAGRDNINTNLRVTMPRNSNPRDRYTVVVEFKTSREKMEGMVSINLGTKISFDVIASEAPVKEKVLEAPKKTQPVIFMVAALIIIAILAIFLVKSFKKPAKKSARKN